MLKESTIKIGLSAVLIAAVCMGVLVTHWPALSAKAFSFDDGQYLIENQLVRNPSWGSARRFLTEVFKPSTVSGYYQPLTMISLMLDYAPGGREDNLFPFHRTSIALHVANTFLVIILLYLLFGNIWAAAAVGLLFGVHPMTVESIPWLGERKTLLSAFFAFWALLFYIRFTRTTGNKKYYIAAIIAYLLALMSKPTSISLPLAMLLVDYWPLNRLSRRAIVEKLPFLFLAAVFVVITLISQMSAGGGWFPGQGHNSLQNPPLIICHNIFFYPLKMLWPANLTSCYQYPQPFGLSNPRVLAAVLATPILIVLLVVSLRWTRAAFTGWLIFFVSILPTMQIFKFSYVIASDKYAYLPSFGLLMILTTFTLWLYNDKSRRAAVISIVVLLLAGAESTATRRYLTCWSDSLTLCKHMLTLAPDSVPLYNNMAWFLATGNNTTAQEAKRAIEFAQRVCVLTDYKDSNYLDTLAVAYAAAGRFEEAITVARKAVGLAEAAGHKTLANEIQDRLKLYQAGQRYIQK